MQKTLRNGTRYLVAFFTGAILLSLFSFYQKALLGTEIFSLNPKAYVVPILFGGGAGLFLEIYYLRIKDSRTELEAYLDSIDNLVQIVDANQHFLYVNKAWRDTLQYTPNEIKKLKLTDVLPPEKKEECLLLFERIFSGEHVGEFDAIFLAKDGHKVYLRGSSNGAKTDGRRQATRGIFKNITERVEAEEFQRLSAQIFENVQEGLLVTNPQMQIRWINPAFSKISGYSQEEALGEDARTFFWVEGAYEKTYSALLHALKSKKSWRGELLAKRKNGEIYPVEMSVSAVYSQLGNANNYICLFSDISERKENERHLQEMARHDPLTTLPNRLYFSQVLTDLLEKCASAQKGFSVFFLDLDGFKSVNDRYGHATGDELLKLVALRLKSSLRQVDAVARLGGDEFGVLLQKTNDRNDVRKIAQNLSEKINAPYLVDGEEIRIVASIGISFYPDHATFEALLHAADQAMYQAKSDPNNTIHCAKATQRPAP